MNQGRAAEIIRRQFLAKSGREVQAAALMERIEAATIPVDLSGSRNFADICNGLFVSPTLRTALGIGEGTPAGQIPRWAAHPALRVIHVARIGATCHQLGLSSMKLMAGAAQMAELAFSAVARGVLASDPGGYALTGEFGIVQENEFTVQPALWDSILKFRNTPAGAELRREVGRRLALNEGAEITSAVDSSMHEAIPSDVLRRSREQMSSLLMATGIERVASAVWSDSALIKRGPEIWRRRTKQRFDTFLRENGIGLYEPCPCGSYEHVKFCCMAALET